MRMFSFFLRMFVAN